MFEEVLRDSKACGKKGIVDMFNDHREDLGGKWSFERDQLLSTKGVWVTGRLTMTGPLSSTFVFISSISVT